MSRSHFPTNKNKTLVKPFYESIGKWRCWTPFYFIKKNEWCWFDFHMLVFSKQKLTWLFDISSWSVCWIMIIWSSVWRAHWWSVCFREMQLKLVGNQGRTCLLADWAFFHWTDVLFVLMWLSVE